MLGEPPELKSKLRASDFAKATKVAESLDADPARDLASTMKDDARELSPTNSDVEENHDLIIRCVRALVADLCQQFDGGHPGGAMGMVPIGICLWKYAMRYSPRHPDWFNRDRFVLSNGHACLLQYIFMHLTGYDAMTLDQLKSYHSRQTETLCPGHPEIQHPGIEVTTGPLGQGIANAVGMAMASRHLAATYNKPRFSVVENTVWCIVGDGCLQEGVGLESVSLAGHWRLDNLIVIYDNNKITSDGPVQLVSHEDIVLKLRASGWHAVTVEDGSSDVAGILEAIQQAKAFKGKPSFINVLTVIGADSKFANTRTAHGTPFGAEEVERMKTLYGFDPAQTFNIPDRVVDFFSDIGPRGTAEVQEWRHVLADYTQENPDLGADLQRRIAGDLSEAWPSFIPTQFPRNSMSTTQSAGLVFHPVVERINSFMVGTADLDSSVNMIWSHKTDFQHPALSRKSGVQGDYRGRYIHWGVREHAMMAVSNGIAAFNPGTIIPVTSTFLIFTLYGAPAIRMGALQQLQVIHIATHDSIGIGADGPTHQPIEVAALFRAMPNMLYIRPADSNETAGAWKVAIEAKQTPSIISLSAQDLPQYPDMTMRDKVANGAYVLIEDAQAELTLIGVGAELSLAVSTKELLAEAGIRARLVSFPCHRLFEQQPREYQRNVLQRHTGIPAVAIEAYAAIGWERYADASVAMTSFGKSLPSSDIHRFFGFEAHQIRGKIEAFMGRWRNGEILQGDFETL